METRAETVDATMARARLGDILARARYGGWRFVIQQRGDPAAVVMGYEDYKALMELLEDLEDVRDMLETEKEPTRPLREYLAEHGRSDANV
jgi:prevent-host-death family protein